MLMIYTYLDPLLSSKNQLAKYATKKKKEQKKQKKIKFNILVLVVR